LFFGDKDESDQKMIRNEKVKKFKKSRFARSLYWLDRKSQNVRRGTLLGICFFFKFEFTKIKIDFEKQNKFIMRWLILVPEVGFDTEMMNLSI